MSDERTDVNKATAEELAALPGIGKALAARIVKYRNDVHPFVNLSDLAEVSGISEDMAAELAEHLVVPAPPAEVAPAAEKETPPAATESAPAEAAAAPAAAQAEVKAQPEAKKATPPVQKPEESEQRQQELRSAARAGDVNKLKALLKAGADGSDKFALIWSAQDGHLAVVAELIKAGSDVNARAGGGTNALELAAQNGHLQVVQALIEAGAELNARAIEGWTPLMKASYFGHAEIVEALLAAGADARARNDAGSTSLALAEQADHQQIIDALRR